MQYETTAQQSTSCQKQDGLQDTFLSNPGSAHI